MYFRQKKEKYKNQIIFYNYLEKKEIISISDFEISQSDIFEIGMFSKNYYLLFQKEKNKI